MTQEIKTPRYQGHLAFQIISKDCNAHWAKAQKRYPSAASFHVSISIFTIDMKN